MAAERERPEEQPERRQAAVDEAILEQVVSVATDAFRCHFMEGMRRKLQELRDSGVHELSSPVLGGVPDEPKTQFQRISEALMSQGNTPRTASWIMGATGISRSALSQILHRTHKDSFISELAPGHGKKKLWALTEEAAKTVGQLVSPFTQPTLFGREGDLAQMIATDCCARILRGHDNQPMSPLTLAKEAIERGYKGRVKGPVEAVLFVIAKSFWSALTRDERFEKMEEAGPEMFRLKEAAAPLEPPGAKDDEEAMEKGTERQGGGQKDEEE